MALYQKHRPQDFSAVAGQEHIIKTILNQILTNKVFHAYLFSGPRGVGKTTTARLLAKAVNCEKRNLKTGEPCNECTSCEEISHSRSIDVIEIDAASNTGVDNVRTNIIENAQFQPTKSKFKVFIIDEVHMLSTSAFNALLKIMEEPPKHVIFILATTELHKLPETIISRCQRFNFKRLSYEQMKEKLLEITKIEDVNIEKEVINLIITKSDGCARDAVSLLEQIMAIGEKTISLETASLVLPMTNQEKTMDFLENFADKKLEHILLQIQETVEQDLDLISFANETIELLRQIMIAKVNPQNLSLNSFNEETKKRINKIAGKFNNSELIDLIDLIMKRKSEIRSAPIPQLPLEMAAVEWCSLENNDNKKASDKQTINPPTKTESTIKNTVSEPIKEKTIVSEIKNIQKNETKESLPPPETFSETNANIDISKIENLWPEFISKVEQYSPSLVFILKMAQIKSFDGSNLILAVQFSFHRDKLLDPKNRREIESRISALVNNKINIDIIVEGSTAKDTNPTQLNELATMFGGEVIN